MDLVSDDVEVEGKPTLHGVHIVTIFSPSKFTIVYSHRPVHLLQELERDMAKSWGETIGFSKEGLIPKSGMFVSYREEGIGSYKRGFIQSIIGQVAEIFFCDYGTFKSVDVYDSCVPLGDVHRLSLGFYASIVVIPGLVPATPLKLSTGTKLIPATSWSKESIEGSKEWLQEGRAFGVTRFMGLSPISFTGDLYRENSRHSFSQFIEEQEYGMIHFN